MKSVSSPLLAHLAGEVTTVATCWKLTRRDNVVMGFTDHVDDIPYLGVVYQAALGYRSTQVQSTAGLQVANLDVQGVLDTSGISEADLAAGVYDGATVEIFLVNYADLSMGQMWLAKGTLGEVRNDQSEFTAELRGLSQPLSRVIGERYTFTCRARLGDSRCKINLASWTVAGTVTAAGGRSSFTDSALSQSAGHFNHGLVTWMSGANDGLSMEVKSFSAGKVVTLVLPMPYLIEVGDTYTMSAGCDNRFVTCKTRFNNVVNFRGEPHIPGLDALTRGPR